MLNELADQLHNVFATDQNCHAQQQMDGSYRRKNGSVTKTLIARSLRNLGSFAIYQKNNDFTIRWICFDFDICKANLNGERRQESQKHLESAIKNFCNALSKLKIPYLLEFSGNRGFHVWITFSEKISYRLGYDIQQALLEATQLHYDKELIGIDLFPKGPVPTDGQGLGVKIPLSKHTKSGFYAVLLSNVGEVENLKKIGEIDEIIINEQIGILKEHRKTTKSEVEIALGTFFNSHTSDESTLARIKSINIQNNSITIAKLFEHWRHEAPLDFLRKKIEIKDNLTHEERKLLVGVLHNIKAKNYDNAGKKLLIEIFSKMENYDEKRTLCSIDNLSSFNFPSQEQIENITKIKFGENYSKENLIKACIPTYKGHEDATFDISKQDIEIAKLAEINYIFMNDEAQSKLTLSELSCSDGRKLQRLISNTLRNPKKASFFKHHRREGKKTRTLISLKAAERLTTSCILKQLTYFFNMQPSSNSHGYKVSKGFAGGYIFQPWLYLWIKFVSNISTAIEDYDNKDYYIVKTDIKSFYDSIPHDNLKRMLLGGVNPRIDAKLSEHTTDSLNIYKSYIDTLFDITEVIVNSNVGLPQGPAYARYLAELYLDNIDLSLDSKLHSEEISLYQRYVDDIFIIASTEDKAKAALSSLQSDLRLLGLETNNEKTSITKIRHFAKDFEVYRSQSKYAVDKVSKNFSDSTVTEQDLAINEFIKLVQSDSCNDDLAFIFSHLAGVPQLDMFKREKIIPTLQSKTGRGSLYKHLFNFALESAENWITLDSVDVFDELQSEVFTACFITQLELNSTSADCLKSLFKKHVGKLSRTELVNEHLAYLTMVNGVDLDMKEIPSYSIIKCLRNIQVADDLEITCGLINQLNTALNDIKDLPGFIEAIYPLCKSRHTIKEDLNSLAATFYAKLSVDMKEGFNSANSDPEIFTSTVAEKYYYLLCLFSISNKNKSPELLKEAWKHCTRIFNRFEIGLYNARDEWLTKISYIEHSEEYAQLMVSSIIDDTIFRGLEDKKGIFRRYHNILLFFIAYQDNNINSSNIKCKLNELKGKADYYKWIMERNGPSIFPNNKGWFELNIIENNAIILRNNNSILIRKPTQAFSENSSPRNEHNGYSEILVDYKPDKLKDFSSSISDKTVVEKLRVLVNIADEFIDVELYPNMFSDAKILIENKFTPFNCELSNLKTLIVQRQDGQVSKLINNRVNFVKSYFDVVSESDGIFKMLNERYIKNLSEHIDYVSFVKNLLSQIDGFVDVDDYFYYDISAAAALYLSIKEVGVAKKIESFIHQYHRFNQDYRDRHIYAVDKNCIQDDYLLSTFFLTVEYSLRKIPIDVAPALALYIYKDITEYRNKIESILEHSDAFNCSVTLEEFVRIHPNVSQIQEIIIVNGVKYKFNDVNIVNVTTGDVHKFEPRHSVLINASEHVYFFEQSTSIYIIALHSFLSVIHKSITDRLTLIAGEQTSYPKTRFTESSILSLDYFSEAVDVVATHRNFSKADAHALLVKWLSSLPRKFYQPLTTLISAHRVMREGDIKIFIEKVAASLKRGSANLFLIKDLKDFNGTHRLLYRDDWISRNIDLLSPLNIDVDSPVATVVVDNLISGTQIIKAIRYYVGADDFCSSENYFFTDESIQAELFSFFKNLDVLHICTVFYTEKGRLNIQKNLKCIFGKDISVQIVNGTNIGDDAFFGTNTKISESEKNNIFNLFTDEDSMSELSSHLYFDGYVYKCREDIDKVNLVARHQSMPKKCFNFLLAGLRHNLECRPLIRILESYEK